MNMNRKWTKVKDIFRLSISLAKANFKVRNEGSFLGIFWYLLNPLSMFLIILLLGKAITQTSIPRYPAYLLIGLIMFNFFRQSTINATSAINGNSGFIKSVKVPYESFIIAGVLESTFSHIFEIIVFGGLLIYLGIPLIGLISYPFIFIFLVLFIIGFSFILATIGVYINDLGNVWNVLVQLLWFATPIFYVVSKTEISSINWYNPMYYIIQVARDLVVYNTSPEKSAIYLVIGFSLIFFAGGLFIFEKFKGKFAELI